MIQNHQTFRARICRGSLETWSVNDKHACDSVGTLASHFIEAGLDKSWVRVSHHELSFPYAKLRDFRRVCDTAFTRNFLLRWFIILMRAAWETGYLSHSREKSETSEEFIETLSLEALSKRDYFKVSSWLRGWYEYRGMPARWTLTFGVDRQGLDRCRHQEMEDVNRLFINDFYRWLLLLRFYRTLGALARTAVWSNLRGLRSWDWSYTYSGSD